MIKIQCSHCDNPPVPVNETIKIDGKTFCVSCLETYFPDEKSLEGRSIEKIHDPTICSFCETDFGSVELKKISIHPVCETCETKIRNRTFPTWVKGFFIGVIAIVIFSFFWNWRYYKAYSNFKKSNDYSSRGDFDEASRFINIASEAAPDVKDLKTLAAYYNGIALLTKDKPSEALAEFNKCLNKMPEDFNLNSLILKARIGSSFDNKDYDGFLSASIENLEIDKTEAVSWTAVASAYACIYVSKGVDSAKGEAIKYIAKAKAIDSTSEEMKAYYNMIEYRIFSRRIIRREQFVSEFPQSWNKN